MADGASASQQKVSLIAETTRGTTPTSPGYTVVPIKSGTTFNVTQEFSQSELIDSSREPGQRVGGTLAVEGTVSVPLIRETAADNLLESALSNAYAAVATSAITGTWAATGSTFTRASGSFLTDSVGARLEVGDLVFGAGTTNNQTTLNGAISSTTATSFTLTAATAFTGLTYVKIDSEIMLVTAISGTSVTVVTRGACGTTAATHSNGATVLPGHQISAITATVLTFGSETVVNETSVATTFTTSTSVLIPGTTRKFFTFEQNFVDKSIFELYKGCEVNTTQINIPTTGEVAVDHNIVGTRSAIGQAASSTYTATAGRVPFGASSTGSSIKVNGSALTTCLVNLQYTINNNRAPRNGVGEQYACFVEEGTRQIDLTFGLYLVDSTFQTYYQAQTRFAILMTCANSTGDRYQFVFPRVLITSLPRAVDGQSIVENASASAEKDSTAGYSHWIRRQILV